jgi:transcriptional regulator with XRE-family HTH domain
VSVQRGEHAPQILGVGQQTLAELAETANREHGAGRRLAQEALSHWMAAGDALLAARVMFMDGYADGDGGRVRRGEWRRWLEANFNGSVPMATACMRFATYRDLIAAEGITTIKPAEAYLRGLPRVGAEDDKRYGEQVRAEARRLRAQGLAQREIGRLLGVTHQTVYRWTNPDGEKLHNERAAAKHRQKIEAAKAKRQAERDRVMRKIGGSVAETYALIRKTAQALDRAEKEAADREVRAALRNAQAKLYNAEDAIVRALGIS